METSLAKPHVIDPLQSATDLSAALALDIHEDSTGILRVYYHSVGSEREQFASHLLSRGTTFQRSQISAPALRIETSFRINLRDDQWFALSGPALLGDGKVCQGVRNGVVCWNTYTGENLWTAITGASVDAVAVF